MREVADSQGSKSHRPEVHAVAKPLQRDEALNAVG
jgi:hypothetical protein